MPQAYKYMTDNRKHITENRQIFGGRGILSEDIKSHSNDPVIVKKVEEAKAFFKKAGFPKAK